MFRTPAATANHAGQKRGTRVCRQLHRGRSFPSCSVRTLSACAASARLQRQRQTHSSGSQSLRETRTSGWSSSSSSSKLGGRHRPSRNLLWFPWTIAVHKASTSAGYAAEKHPQHHKAGPLSAVKTVLMCVHQLLVVNSVADSQRHRRQLRLAIYYLLDCIQSSSSPIAESRRRHWKKRSMCSGVNSPSKKHAGR